MPISPLPENCATSSRSHRPDRHAAAGRAAGQVATWYVLDGDRILVNMDAAASASSAYARTPASR